MINFLVNRDVKKRNEGFGGTRTVRRVGLFSKIKKVDRLAGDQIGGAIEKEDVLNLDKWDREMSYNSKCSSPSLCLSPVEISKKYGNFVKRLNMEVSNNSGRRDLVSISKNYEIDLLQISNCFRSNLAIKAKRDHTKKNLKRKREAWSYNKSNTKILENIALNKIKALKEKFPEMDEA